MDSGIELSLYVILGIGGTDRTTLHASRIRMSLKKFSNIRAYGK